MCRYSTTIVLTGLCWDMLENLSSRVANVFPVMAVFIGGLKWFVYTSGLSGESWCKLFGTEILRSSVRPMPLGMFAADFPLHPLLLLGFVCWLTGCFHCGVLVNVTLGLLMETVSWGACIPRLFFCCCLVAPRLFTFCALFCRFICIPLLLLMIFCLASFCWVCLFFSLLFCWICLALEIICLLFWALLCLFLSLFTATLAPLVLPLFPTVWFFL